MVVLSCLLEMWREIQKKKAGKRVEMDSSGRQKLVTFSTVWDSINKRKKST